MRNTIIIIFIVFVVALGAVIGTYFFFVDQSTGDVPISLRDIFPFGQGGDVRDIPPRADFGSGEQVPEATPDEDTEIPVLRQLYEDPVSGAITFEDLGTSTIRFVDRATGHVFEIRENEQRPRRIANTTLPRIQHAVFANPDTVLMQYVNRNGSIQTFVGAIADASEGGEQELIGSFLPADARSLAARGDSVFYTLRDEASGYMFNIETGGTRSVLPIPFTEWTAQWLSENRLALTTKASADALGTMYVLNVDTSALSRVLGNHLGLTTRMNADGARVLFSETNSGLATNILNVETDATTPLSQRTLAEKCVWSAQATDIVYCGVPERLPAGTYPDSWYQGRVTFSDSIWLINTQDGTGERIVRPEDAARTSLDVSNPLLTEDESHFVFTNRTDGSLWALELPEQEPALLDE